MRFNFQNWYEYEQWQKQQALMRFFRMFTVMVFCLIFWGFFFWTTWSHAAELPGIPAKQAIRILVGEAANQGFIGMVCVGEVLRRQGSTRGFYGLNAKHSAQEPLWVWKMAKKAWLASASTNYTHGADHFENLKLNTPYWVKNCVLTFKYKDHAFYKEVY